MAQVQPSTGHYPRRGPPDADRPKGARVVVMRGEHDLTTTVVLAQMFRTAIAVDNADLVVDASEVTFLDASTLGVLIGAQNFLRERSRSLLVRSPSVCVRRIFDMCDLGSLIEGTESHTVANEPVALAALETWVAVPTTIPEHHPSPSLADDTNSCEGATGDDHHRRTPQLAMIGVPTDLSIGGEATPTAAGP